MIWHEFLKHGKGDMVGEARVISTSWSKRLGERHGIQQAWVNTVHKGSLYACIVIALVARCWPVKAPQKGIFPTQESLWEENKLWLLQLTADTRWSPLKASWKHSSRALFYLHNTEAIRSSFHLIRFFGLPLQSPIVGIRATKNPMSIDCQHFFQNCKHQIETILSRQPSSRLQ